MSLCLLMHVSTSIVSVLVSSRMLHVFTITEDAVAADVKKGGKAAGKREITFSFIYKQHRWLKRTLCNFGVKRSLIGISNLYAGYE